MVKKTVASVVVLTLAIAVAFTVASALPFPWDSQSQSPSLSHQMAPPNTPEPNAGAGVALPSWAPLVKRVMPTVVNVAVVETVKNAGFSLGGQQEGPGDEGGGNNPFGANPGNPFGFMSPFGSNPFGSAPHQFKEHALGSGVIVSPDGYILTNNHVVENADRIRVTLMDKREFTARVIGTDPKTDLALIKIKADQSLPYASMGDSTTVEVGDWVMAIGNPFGFNLTVTAGIVSAKGRALGGNYDDFIQTDASINPGNSGGPLFDTQGRVIGINSAIYSTTGNNAGIGFAIPIDLAKSVMDQLREHGRVIRGWLGVEVQEVTPELAQSFGLPKPQGALVAKVENNTPAAKAGVQRGDVIVKFAGATVHDEHELPELVAQAPIGKSVPIEVIRNGKHLTLDATIARMPNEQVASADEGDEPAQKWGVSVQDLTPDIAQQLGLKGTTKGVVINNVQPDSPAGEAGLQRGDVVMEVDHSKVASAQDFAELAKKVQKEHKSALLLVQRGDATLFTVVNPKG
jgi:serine protease Do